MLLISTPQRCSVTNLDTEAGRCTGTSDVPADQHHGPLAHIALLGTTDGLMLGCQGYHYTVPGHISREMCIETDNNPSDGAYFEDPGILR